MLASIEACRLSVAGCWITIVVDEAGGPERQVEVAAAINARVGEFAEMVVAELRANVWTVVDDAVLDAPRAVAAAVPPPPHPAWVAATNARGGPQGRQHRRRSEGRP